MNSSINIVEKETRSSIVLEKTPSQRAENAPHPWQFQVIIRESDREVTIEIVTTLHEPNHLQIRRKIAPRPWLARVLRRLEHTLTLALAAHPFGADSAPFQAALRERL